MKLPVEGSRGWRESNILPHENAKVKDKRLNVATYWQLKIITLQIQSKHENR